MLNAGLPLVYFSCCSCLHLWLTACFLIILYALQHIATWLYCNTESWSA